MSDFRMEHAAIDGLYVTLFGEEDYAEVEVPSLTEPSTWYTVSIMISKPMLHCTCSRPPRPTCRHTEWVVRSIVKLPAYQERFLKACEAVDAR